VLREPDQSPDVIAIGMSSNHQVYRIDTGFMKVVSERLRRRTTVDKAGPVIPLLCSPPAK
jgi:hypothetical protein